MKIVSADEVTKIKAFEKCVNEMINGKFILADVKISNILKSIAQSKELYNFLAECLLGFDFDKEFDKSCTNVSGFRMPDEPYKRIALVFVFLVNVDSKKIIFYDFINKYFRTDVAGGEYAQFAKIVLTPFKNDMVAHFDLEGKNAVEEVVEEDNTTEEVNISGELIKCLNDMQNIIDINLRIKDYKKEEMTIYMKALAEGIKIRNKRIVSALATAFDRVVRKEKTLRDLYAEFTSLLIRFY